MLFDGSTDQVDSPLLFCASIGLAICFGGWSVFNVRGCYRSKTWLESLNLVETGEDSGDAA
jgi:hypothetical protein